MVRWAPFIFSLVLALLFLYFFVEALGFSERAKRFPLAVSGPMFLLASIHATREGLRAVQINLPGWIRRWAPPPSGTSAESSGEDVQVSGTQRLEALVQAAKVEIPLDVARQRTIVIVLWMLGSFVGLWLIGFREGLPLFVLTYLLLQSKEKIWFAAVAAIVVWLALEMFFGRALLFPWPQPQLALWFGFEWPGIR